MTILFRILSTSAIVTAVVGCANGTGQVDPNVLLRRGFKISDSDGHEVTGFRVIGGELWYRKADRTSTAITGRQEKNYEPRKFVKPGEVAK